MTAESRPCQGAANANGNADKITVDEATDNNAGLAIGGTTFDPPALLPQHQLMLEASGIPCAFAAKFGVRSITNPAELPDSLLMHAYAGVPGLVFPWTSPDGTVSHQLRPDDPPEVDGKPRKYLQGVGVRLLNVLGDPAQADTVWIVEGTKQSLAARTYAPPNTLGIAIPGCANAMADGQLLPGLADLIEGLPVVVFFNADLATNQNVWQAAHSLEQALELEGATEVRFAQIPGAGKAGLDDLLGARSPEKRDSSGFRG